MTTQAGSVKSYHAHMSAIGFVRVWPGLHPAILRAGASVPYRMWTLIRSLDTAGSGVIGRDHLLRSLHLEGITKAHLRTAVAKQRAIFGHDAFFTVDVEHNRITYRSLEAIAAMLHAAPGRSAYILRPGIRSMEQFNASIYATWLHATGEAGRMISRAKLEEITGVSAQTLRRWEKAAGVEVTANVVELAEEDAEIAAEHITEDDRPHKAEAQPTGYIFRRGGRLYYRTVNQYAPQRIVTGNRGRAHKAAKAANRAAGGLSSDAAKKQDRIFFGPKHLSGRRQLVTGPSVHAQNIAGRQPTIRIQHGTADLWSFSRMKPAAWRF